MKRITTLILLSLASLTASGHVHATKPTDWSIELTPAQQAFAAGDYDNAYTRYLQNAERNPLAQLMLGLFHQHGWGRAQDPVAACAWFEKSARRKIPTAQHHFGDCLAHGIGRPADVPAALVWYEKAAAGGHLLSLCSAAHYLVQGKGVPKDLPRGLELCAQAAQANSPPAMLALARYLQQAEDTPRHLAVARHWFEAAAQRGVGEAQYRFGLMLAAGEGGAADINAALFWLETAASNGHAPAYLPTAMLYANAPPVTETGALAPEHLAKVYLWMSAAKARADDDTQRADLDRLEAQVLAVMPAAWRPGLDRQVAEHLAIHSR